MLGWMIVLVNSSWRTTEVDRVRAEELIAVLRKRQNAADAPAVLDRCEEMGAWLWAEGESLRVKGPPLPDDLRSDLKRCKFDLLKLLAAVPAWDDVEANELQKKL